MPSGSSSEPNPSWFVFCGGDARSAEILHSLLANHLAQVDEAHDIQGACEFGVLTAPALVGIDVISTPSIVAGFMQPVSQTASIHSVSFPRHGRTRAPPSLLYV